MAVSKSTAKDVRLAGADLTNSLYRCVKLNSSGQFVLCVAGDTVYGTVYEGAAAGYGCTVDVDGIVKAIAGGTIAAGANVSSDANAAVVTSATGNKIFGVAREAAVAGQIFAVQKAVAQPASP